MTTTGEGTDPGITRETVSFHSHDPRCAATVYRHPRRAGRGQRRLRRPVHEPLFTDVVADQVEFLRTHVRVLVSDR